MDNDHDLLERVARAEARVAELETQFNELLEISIWMKDRIEQYQSVISDFDGIRSEVDNIKLEVDKAKAESKQLLQEMEQKYVALLNEWRDEMLSLYHMLADDELSPQQKLDFWSMRLRYKNGKL